MAQAYISKIDSRFVQSINKNMYDIIMSNGDKIGAGSFAPKGFQAGDYVEYEYDVKGTYKNLKPGSLSKIAAPAGVTQAAAPAPTVAAPTVSYDSRQTIISKQAALNSAIAYVNILAHTDSIPGITKSLATDKKADVILEVVNQFTADFYKQSTGEVFPELSDSAASSGDIQQDLAAMEDKTAWTE